MKNNYWEYRAKQQSRYNALPFLYAYTKEQLQEAMAEKGIKSTEELVSMYPGVLCRKSDLKHIKQVMKELEDDLAQHMLDYDFAYAAFSAELANHEYCIHQDPEDTFYSLGLSYTEVANNPVMKKAFLKAERDYLREADREGWF